MKAKAILSGLLALGMLLSLATEHCRARSGMNLARQPGSDSLAVTLPAPGHGALRLQKDPESENVVLVGHLGGRITAVAVADDYLYAANGRRLTVFDISSPSSPTVVGRTPPYSRNVVSIAMSDGPQGRTYAYLGVMESGLRVVDVSSPVAPVEVGSLLLQGHACDVVVAGAYAYVAAEFAGLRIVDISTPSNPELVGSYISEGVIDAVDVNPPDAHGKIYAYLDETAGLRVVDVTTPSNPKMRGLYQFRHGVGDVAVAAADPQGRTYAYLAVARDGLRVVDVSDPLVPAEVGSIDTPGNAVGVALKGHCLCGRR